MIPTVCEERFHCYFKRTDSARFYFQQATNSSPKKKKSPVLHDTADQCRKLHESCDCRQKLWVSFCSDGKQKYQHREALLISVHSTSHVLHSQTRKETSDTSDRMEVRFIKNVFPPNLRERKSYTKKKGAGGWTLTNKRRFKSFIWRFLHVTSSCALAFKRRKCIALLAFGWMYSGEQQLN